MVPHKRYGSTAAANLLEIRSGSALLLERCVELRKYRLPARDTFEQCSVCGHVGGSGAERLAKRIKRAHSRPEKALTR